MKSNNMRGIDIIVPVHKINEEVNSLLKHCLTSINDMALFSNDITVDVNLVVAPDLEIDLEEFTHENIAFNLKLVENTTGNVDFCSQVNYGVRECKNDYFMIVEFDDVVNEKWLNMAKPYVESRKKCSMFLPLIEVYDINNQKIPVSYCNEIGWSSSFVENELGSLDNTLLMDYYNFNLTGSIIKRNDFVKAGGLKPSIKLSFGYELMLRLTNMFSEVFVVPKIGYFHFINREDSLTSEYHNTMTQEEGAWWIKLATQEFLFKKDRNKTYSKFSEEE